MGLFDSHAHYDDSQFDADRDAVLAALPAAGVSCVVCPASDLASAQACVALAERYDFIYAAVGVHPHEAAKAPVDYLAQLRELATCQKVRAIGEIGLDYHYDFSPRSLQQRLLDEQLALAQELHLPAIIHEREAVMDTFDLVQSHRSTIGVYHCYSGSREMARQILDLGYYISFTGLITFANAKRAQEAVQYVPLDRMLLETDSPYMAPVPHRGQRNDSRHIHLVCERIAQLKGLSSDAVAQATERNAKAFFSIV